MTQPRAYGHVAETLLPRLRDTIVWLEYYEAAQRVGTAARRYFPGATGVTWWWAFDEDAWEYRTGAIEVRGPTGELASRTGLFDGGDAPAELEALGGAIESWFKGPGLDYGPEPQVLDFDAPLLPESEHAAAILEILDQVQVVLRAHRH